MSTKIYNGYVLENVSTIAELDEFCKKARQIIGNALEEEHKFVFSNFACQIFDLVTNGFTFEEIKNIFKVIPEKEYLMNDRFGLNCVAFATTESWMEKTKSDEKNSLQIIPIKNKILMLSYTNKPLPEQAKEYCYFNNTDRPDEISEEEWEQRRLDWDEALKDDYIPSKHGVTLDVQFSSSPFNYEYNYISKLLKGFEKEKRIKTVAQHRIKKEYMDILPIELSEQEKLSSYNKFLKTDEYDKKFKKEMVTVKIKSFTKKLYEQRVNEIAIS